MKGESFVKAYKTCKAFLETKLDSMTQLFKNMSDAAQEFRFFLNVIAFSIILFVIFLHQSMKERERQRELASKWKSLNDKIKAARSILIMRQLAKKKRYQKEIRSKWPKLSNVSLFISHTSSTGSDESTVNMVTLDIKLVY